jgi:hypothetical protein
MNRRVDLGRSRRSHANAELLGSNTKAVCMAVTAQHALGERTTTHPLDRVVQVSSNITRTKTWEYFGDISQEIRRVCRVVDRCEFPCGFNFRSPRICNATGCPVTASEPGAGCATVSY